MKKLFLQSITLLLVFTAVSSLWAMEQPKIYTTQNTVVLFNIDGVISNIEITLSPATNLKESWDLMKTFFTILKCLSLLNISKEITDKIKELSKRDIEKNLQKLYKHENIFYELMRWLEDEKNYKNMVQYTDFLVENFVQITPNKYVISIIEKLKLIGFTVFFTTNRNREKFEKYCTKILELGYDISKLFDGGVVYSTKTNRKQQTLQNDTLCFTTKYTKSENEYYDVLRRLAHSFKKIYYDENKINIIFIGDQKSNVDVANKQNNVTGIHFESADQILAEFQKLIPYFKI